MEHPFFYEDLGFSKADLAIAFQYVTEDSKTAKFLKFCEILNYIFDRKVEGVFEMSMLDFS